MRPSFIFFFYLLLASFTSSLPTEHADFELQRRADKLDKGKGRADRTPTPDPGSRSPTPEPGSRAPTPEPGDEAPLPGRTGISTLQRPDGVNVHTGHYGDDHLLYHGNHVDRNQQRFPENRASAPLSRGGNRPEALRAIAPGGQHPVTGEDRDRDEKPPNMFDVPNRESRTTVEYRPKSESRGRGILRRSPPRYSKFPNNANAFCGW